MNLDDYQSAAMRTAARCRRVIADPDVKKLQTTYNGLIFG